MATVELCATVRETVRFEGVGLHTGELCRIAIHPASEAHTPCAITLRKGTSVFPARWDFVVDTTRATVLGDGATRVSTVEHLMAALWITGITHCDIEVLQGNEIPILVGSRAKRECARLHPQRFSKIDVAKQRIAAQRQPQVAVGVAYM